jgi:uncharacterized phage protein (TIGR01671 family)
MREIRFRAKRQDNGEWIRSSTIVTFDVGDTVMHYMPASPGHCDACADKDGNLTALDATFFLVRPDTIGQFIGEQDADGHDIYEGDVVQHGEKRYVIRYINHYARFAGKNKGTTFAVFAFGNCTILGNIHDNAYLMEAAK